jgi:DHA1 family bicyclomycin/chloramphenicol resistance-like MFS transporter
MTYTRSATSLEFTILMALLMSIVAISIDALLPALGIIGESFGITHPNQVQYVIGFLFLGMAVGELICGPLSDALGRKRILYGSIVLYLAGSVISFMAGSFEILLAGRLLQGIGVAGPYVSTMSVVRDKYEGREMARVMSLVMMIFIMVPALAPALGQGILYIADWRYIFLLYIVYSITIIVWISFRLEETLPPEKRIPFRASSMLHGFREVLTNRITTAYILCMSLIFGGLIGYLNSAQQIFQVQFGTGEAFTLYFGGLALVLGIASLLNSRIVEKMGMRYLCKRSIIAMIISSILFLIVHQVVEIQLWMFLIYAAIIYFSMGLLFGNLNALAMEPMGHIAGIAAAVIGFVSSLISMACGTVIGQMYDGTLVPLTSGILILACLSAVIMRMVARPMANTSIK